MPEPVKPATDEEVEKWSVMLVKATSLGITLADDIPAPKLLARIRVEKARADAAEQALVASQSAFSITYGLAESWMKRAESAENRVRELLHRDNAGFSSHP
jgi:hypothetical protein